MGRTHPAMNPFVADGPVPEAGFVGRAEGLAKLERAFATGKRSFSSPRATTFKDRSPGEAFADPNPYRATVFPREQARGAAPARDHLQPLERCRSGRLAPGRFRFELSRLCRSEGSGGRVNAAKS